MAKILALVAVLFLFVFVFTQIRTATQEKITSLPNTDINLIQFGVFTDWTRTPEGYNVAYANELGSTIARPILPWFAIEPQQGNLNFTLADSLINAHYTAGIDMVVQLASNSSWATKHTGGRGSYFSSMPKDMETYGHYVRQVVERYKDKVRYWQIENEILYDAFWNGTHEEYKKLLAFSYDTIKAVDPDAQVVLAGIPDEFLIWAGDSTAERHTEAVDSLVFLLNDCGEYFDVIDFHQYFEPEISLTIVPTLYELMEKYGHEKEVINTEAGGYDLRLFARHAQGDSQQLVTEIAKFPEVPAKLAQLISNGLTLDDFIVFAEYLKRNDNTRPLLEKNQSEDIVKRLSLTHGQGVQKVFWVGIQDDPKETAPEFFHTFMGLVDSNGRKKPLFYTYKLMIDKLNGSIAARIVSQEPYVVEYIFPDKPSTFVAWSTREKSYDLSSLMTEEKVAVTEIITEAGKTDHDAVESITTSNHIPLGETPIFIEPTPQAYLIGTLPSQVRTVTRSKP